MMSVWMHPSAGLEAQARKRAACRETNAVDPAFHYVSPHQAKLWTALHAACSPAFGAAYDGFFADAVPHLPANSHLIALGCGGGGKDLRLLEAMQRGGRMPAGFTPQDVSPSLALLCAEAALNLEAEGEAVWPRPIHPIVGDLLAMDDLAEWLNGQDNGAPRVITAFGLLPNFEPDAFLPWLARLLRPQDVLLLSANLAPVAAEDDAPDHRQAYLAAAETILPQYDNPPTRAWLTRVLHDWGWDAELDLESYGMRLVARHGLLCFEATLLWNDGQRLRLFRSYRYTPKRLRLALARHGLALGPGRVAGNREEGVWSIRLATE